MPLAFPEPETWGLRPTNQARDMVVGDLNGLLGGRIALTGRARVFAPIWATRLFESQPILNHGTGFPFKMGEDRAHCPPIPFITTVSPKARSFMAGGYWTRRNIKQSILCTDFPEAIENKQRNIYF